MIQESSVTIALRKQSPKNTKGLRLSCQKLLRSHVAPCFLGLVVWASKLFWLQFGFVIFFIFWCSNSRKDKRKIGKKRIEKEKPIRVEVES